MSKEIIAVDLGGTQIRTARFDHKLNLLQRENTLTLAREGPEATIKRLKEYIAKVLPNSIDSIDNIDSNDGIAGIGISSPGPLNPMSGVIVAPSNLPGWHEVPLADIIYSKFGLPVFIGNDANVAALAEASKGAAQGHRHVVYITVSTGIGAGMICAGRMLLGREGLAAEFGHIPIIVERGKVSSIELEAAGPAIARRTLAALRAGRQSSLSDMLAADQGTVDAKAVAIAAAAGDQLAREVYAYAGRVLGLGIVNVLHLFNPQAIVLGGGVIKAGELLLAPMRAAIRQHVLDDAYIEDLIITTAALGDDVALVGAAALVATNGGNMDISELDRLF